NSYFSRFGGELGNENAIGISIGLAAVFTFYFIYAERKLAYILPLTVMIPSALLTGSRKVVILFLFNFTLIPSLYYIRFQKIKLRSVLKFIGLSLLIVFLLYYAIFNIPVFYQSIGKRVQALFVFSTGGYVKDYSLVERRYMMDSGLRFFSEKPLVGHGIDNFRALFISVPGGKDTYAHNNFIELLVDVGILGFIFFYLTHFFALQHLSALSKRGSKSVAVMSYVMSSIIISYVILSIAQVYYYDKHFSILLAISSSLCSSEKRK
ncbi:O-antigen ligase family protein, partial [Fervidobacterium sp.]